MITRENLVRGLPNTSSSGFQHSARRCDSWLYIWRKRLSFWHIVSSKASRACVPLRKARASAMLVLL